MRIFIAFATYIKAVSLTTTDGREFVPFVGFYFILLALRRNSVWFSEIKAICFWIISFSKEIFKNSQTFVERIFSTL